MKKSGSNELDSVAKDIAVLQLYRNARLKFNAQIVAASHDKSPGIITALRSDATYQLAEFYYLLSGFGIKAPSEFDELIERHNEYISALLTDPEKMQRMGLSKERLLASIFDGEMRPRLLKIWSDDPGALDQLPLPDFWSRSCPTRQLARPS